MSSPATTKPFDLVIGWQPLNEEIVAAHLLSDAPCLAMKEHGRVFKQEQLDLCKGKRVLVCGSHFSARELLRIVDVASAVQLWAYSAADMQRILKECRIERPDGRVPTFGTFNMGMFAAFPRTTRLLRRSLEPKHEEQKRDEYFYRGLQLNAFRASHLHGSDNVHMIKEWLTGGTSEPLEEAEDRIIRIGIHAAIEDARVAVDIVKNGAVVIARPNLKIDAQTMMGVGVNLKARVVVSGCSLVMPVANEAAKDVDIGVVVRYDLGKKLTMLTFVSLNGTSLAFVEEKDTWHGGGRDACKGTTLAGLVTLDTILEMLTTGKSIDEIHRKPHGQ